MTRVKGGVITRRRHKKILDKAKGFQGTNSRLYKRASDAVLHAGEYAFAGRKDHKGVMRRTWISSLNAAVRAEGLRYSEFISKLKNNNIDLDRKVLADIAVNSPKAFSAILSKIK